MNAQEVANKFDLSVDTLRYYEKIGVIPPVNRLENGYRDYQDQDLNWIYLVKNLRKAGMSIESLKNFCQIAQDRRNGLIEDGEQQQKQILIDQLSRVDEELAEIQRARNLLAYKIDTFDDHVAKIQAEGFVESSLEKLWEVKH